MYLCSQTESERQQDTAVNPPTVANENIPVPASPAPSSSALSSVSDMRAHPAERNSVNSVAIIQPDQVERALPLATRTGQPAPPTTLFDLPTESHDEAASPKDVYVAPLAANSYVREHSPPEGPVASSSGIQRSPASPSLKLANPTTQGQSSMSHLPMAEGSNNPQAAAATVTLEFKQGAMIGAQPPIQLEVEILNEDEDEDEDEDDSDEDFGDPDYFDEVGDEEDNVEQTLFANVDDDQSDDTAWDPAQPVERGDVDVGGKGKGKAVEEGSNGNKGTEKRTNRGGALPKEAIRRCIAKKDEVKAWARDMAAEYGKPERVFLMQAGMVSRSVQQTNPWNLYQRFQKVLMGEDYKCTF